MQIVYVGSDGVTKDVTKAFQFDSYDSAVEYRETIDIILANSVPRQWFIGEMVPACRGYFGDFGGSVDG